MQKKLLGAIILSLLLFSGAVAQNVQLLDNPGMEIWTNGPSSAPDNWIDIHPDSIFATQEGTIFYNGSYSSNLTWITPTQAQCDFLSDPVAVTAGSVYACSTWALDNDSGGRITVSLRFDVANYYPAGLYTVDSPNWQQIGFTYTAPVNATSVRVGVRCYDFGSWDGSSTVYVDDVHLWGPEVSGNTPPSITGVLRYPFPTVNPGENVIAQATIIDSEGSVASDSLYRRALPGAFSPVVHDSIAAGDIYWFTIGSYSAGDSVEYYVAATDNEGARSQSPTRGFTVTGGTPPSTVPIYAIQHTTFEDVLPACFPSDSVNMAQTVTGIIVGRYERSAGSPPYQSRFLMQDATSPWSGLNVYFAPSVVQVGDSVTVTGTIIEYFSETELQSITSFTNHLSGHSLFAPNVVTCATYNSQDSCSLTMEPYEGMIIQINNLTLTSSAGFGDFWANDGGADSVIVLNDLSTGGADSCIFTIGQTFTYVRGIGRYTFGQYKIAPRFSSDLYTAPTECTGGNIFDVQFTFDPGTDTADCWPSPDTAQFVTVCGIVTAVTQGTQPRFYLQDQANTSWGGIYCFDYTLYNSGDPVNVAVGDYVQLTSRVHEYFGWTELDSITEFTTLGTNQPLPDTTVLTVSNLIAMCDYTTEPYEDILARINSAVVTSDNGFGELWIRDASSNDSIRIDSDLWTFGLDQPNPLPAVGSTYDWVVGVLRWEGRQGPTRDRGWLLMPRFASDYHQSVFPEPEFVDVWSVNSTTLAATFDRVMDPITCQNPANYSTTHGLSITVAVLDPLGRKVTLTTGAQTDNMVDSLSAINLCDDLGTCMTVPHYGLFHSGITPISTIETPGPGGDSSAIVDHIVTTKAVVVSDTSMAHVTNLFINDTSGPPYNGVNVYLGGFTGTKPVKGDTIIITAHVAERFLNTQLDDIGVYNNLVILSSGGDPVPATVTANDLMGSGVIVDFTREELENVLVTVCDSFTIIDDIFDGRGFVVRSLSVSTDTFVVHHENTQTQYSYVPVIGNTIRGITGVFWYRFDHWRLMPRYDADINSFDTWCGGGPGDCVYIPGDINNFGGANGIDVTFGVSYFKGGAEPPIDCNPPCTLVPDGPDPGTDPDPAPDPFFASGDVNGNCQFNGIDVTYFVAYLKEQQPALLYCPTCPPAALSNPAPETPAIVPGLKAKASNLRGNQE